MKSVRQHWPSLPMVAALFLGLLILNSCGCGTDVQGREIPPLDAPCIPSVTPPDGAVDVPIDTEVVVIFCSEMSDSTVNGETFIVVERGGDVVPGTILITYIEIDGEMVLVATFVPDEDLQPCTVYDIVLSAGIQDEFGQPQPALGSSFTTGGESCDPLPPPPECIPPINFGTAVTYAVLAGTTVTNTGATTLDGDLGLSPGSSVTGAPMVTGETHIADADAVLAQNDLITAYDEAVAMPTTASRIGDIGGEVLFAGVYTSTSSLSVQRADLVLVGGPDDVFVFQMVSSLTIGSGRKIVLQGVRACNVIWQVGSSAILETGVEFEGSILALTSITLQTGTTANGRMLARNGQVSLDTNFVAVP